MPGGVDAVTTFMFQLSSKCDVVFFFTGSVELAQEGGITIFARSTGIQCV